ncbi:flagellar protein FlaG [Glycocaulis alkaliphilus]|uniref:flagellar protein FlaG n=1 Tax=Glycocaulis alkaliphilus TaxID=1434191 RepID=UPI000FD7AE71|nr:flagellar protein FlaG [Glycocaulis alkaliphilus]GGB68202.1 hypothetical protein GCM10007417_05070 [Glycocaulis alkaliphilus]
MNAITAISGRELVVPVTGIAMSAAPVSAAANVVQPVEQGARQPNPDARDTLRQSEAIEEMRAQLSATGRTRLQIERDEDKAGRFIYKLMDPDTGETLRRWPPESFGDLVSFLRNETGGLINETA